MIQELDTQQTGEIDFESFVGAMSRKVQTDLTSGKTQVFFPITLKHIYARR
jgi:Ca2+-binding EF-hand superfamily protein